MKVLALETATRQATVAIVHDQQVLVEQPLDARADTAAMITVVIRDQLNHLGWQPNQIDLVAVSRGPGSFTGLRVGITAAKTWAYSTGCDLIAVETLHALAAQAAADLSQTDVPIAAIIDAQRRQLYSALFRHQPTRGWAADGPAAIHDVSDWLSALPSPVVVNGPVLRRIRDQLPAHVRVANESRWNPNAATVARLAIEQWQQGKRDDPFALTPFYLRPSAAEEKSGL